MCCFRKQLFQFKHLYSANRTGQKKPVKIIIHWTVKGTGNKCLKVHNMKSHIHIYGFKMVELLDSKEEENIF